MRTKVFRGAMVAVGCALVSTTVEAGSPVGSAFTYQGQLKENGAPSNGDFDFRFTLSSPDATLNIVPFDGFSEDPTIRIDRLFLEK